MYVKKIVSIFGLFWTILLWDYLSLQVPHGKSWAVFSVDKGGTREYPILTVSHVYSVSTAASASSSDLQRMCFPCAKEFHYPHRETRNSRQGLWNRNSRNLNSTSRHPPF